MFPFGPRAKRRKAHDKPAKKAFTFERLESRSLLTALSVLNLDDHGAGSLRQAILDANTNADADVISFNVAGVIRLTSGALPTLVHQANIDGTTAPGFTLAPLVEIDFNHFNGLQFDSGASGSALHSLALVGATGDGVMLNGSDNITVASNYIGLALDGTTVAGNDGNGLEIRAASGNTVSANVISGNSGNGVLITGQATTNTLSGNYIGTNAAGSAALGNRLDGVRVEDADHNVIGQTDPVSGIAYYNADQVSMQPVNAWQGIRAATNAGEYLISGTSGDDGLLFVGTMEGVGTSYAVNAPGAASTSVYGPDLLQNGDVRLVGSYKNHDASNADVKVHSFLYQGPLAGLSQDDNYRIVDYSDAEFTYLHSTMGGFAVGNYDSALEHGQDGLLLGPGHAFLYDVANDVFLTDITYPGAKSNTAYGIWFNGGTSYTICGGYSLDPVNNFEDQNQPIGQGYLVDYDSVTGLFTNWKSFDYPNGVNYITHFEGISSTEKGVYTLSADSVQAGSTHPVQGSWVTVRRDTDGSFGDAEWVDLNYNNSGPNVSSSNSVYGNQVVGISVSGAGVTSFQATVNIAFQLSNVISGNGASGIGLYGANNNQIAMNYIGTDLTGTVDLGNAENGILVTAASADNLIGGEATGGNDPTDPVFVRPPQGNLISGNNANGVLITGEATGNQLSGNFIGTMASGNAALGNLLDGVAIVNADNNSLIGCTFQQNPFVFYNVISGNGANGLRVANSDDTTIQANFFGMGANNGVGVGNVLNGVVVEGSSTRTVMGGPIPLGNVDAANGQNGIVVKDTASFFTTYNTFCGLAAFSDLPNFGNGRDGMLITSTGGNILIRTNVITENGDDGIEISGEASDVRVAGNIIGLNTQGLVPMGNHGNGVEVGGNAHDNVIGGPQPTFNVIPNNAISANGGNGVAFLGTAHDNTVDFSFIGTNILGDQAQGNVKAGVLLGPGSYSNKVGSTDPTLLTVISGNLGNGVEMHGTSHNEVIGSIIGMSAHDLHPMGNGGSGVFIADSSQNLVGVKSSFISQRLFMSANVEDASRPAGSANQIAFNGASGVFVASGHSNGVGQNSIHDNAPLGISLAPGANMNMQPPLLTAIQWFPSSIQGSGTLTAPPNSTYAIEFFANQTAGPSGDEYLASQRVSTNAAGFAAFTFTLPLPANGARFITATATDPLDNTSQFSLALS